MTIQKLKKEIIEKKEISRQGVEARVKKCQSMYGPFSQEIAYGVIAQQAGVDVSKIITDPNILAIIRQEVDRIKQLSSDISTIKPRTVIKTINVNFAKDLILHDPILNAQTLEDAKLMAATYTELYVFENSVREVINKVLSREIGTDWWDKSVGKTIQDNVKKRIAAELNNAWHGRRGSHPIYYTNISDLQLLIQKHWQFFKKIFPNQNWVNIRINEIELSRNIIDHHNPLQKKDRQRVSIYLKDWNDQISDKKDLIQ